MAKRLAIPFKHMALKVVGPRGEYLAARIQRLDMPVNLPSTDIDELGNSHHAGTTTDIPDVTTTFQAMDVSIKLFAALTGYDATAYPGGGVDIGELGVVDVIGVVKDANISDYVKSVHLRKCQITGFTYTYSVDSESTEEYTAGGSEKRWFKYDVVVDTFTNDAGIHDLSEHPRQLKNNDYCVSAILDKEYLEEVFVAPASGEYYITFGGGAGGADQISTADTIDTALVVVYHSDVAGDNWVDVSDDTIPAAIRGGNVPITIALQSIPRVQSVTLRGTFPNTIIKEMGTKSAVGTLIQVPAVTGDISVLDTDLELLALLITGQIAPSGVEEFRSCEFTASGLALKIELNDPADDPCGDGGSVTVLKTLYIPEITVTSEGHTTNVGGNATQTFGFKSNDGSLYVYSGTM